MVASDLREQPMAQFRNTVVSRTELSAALAAIENRLVSTISEDHESSEKDEEMVRRLKNQAFVSLTANLQRVVEPVADEEYGQMVNRQSTRLDKGNEDEENALEDDENDDDDEDDDLSSEEELDDALLLDQDALGSAAQLREQVREKSLSVAKLQESLSHLVVESTQKEISDTVRDLHAIRSEQFDTDAFMAKLKEIEPKSPSKRAAIREMDSNVQKLTEEMESINLAIPTRLHSLQETIGTIDFETKRSKQPEILSQTEQAILSRTNEGGVVEEGTSFHSDPAQRLSSFLSSTRM